MGLVKNYGIKGFRSPSWLRSKKLFGVLQDYFDYDSSIPDVDYMSPAGIGGCCSVFPFRIGKLVELPTTIPYEFPEQSGITRQGLNDFWKIKIEWIKNIGGLILVITHPDPYYGGNNQMVNMYKKFLEGLRQDKDILCLRPCEAAEYYNDNYPATDRKVDN